MAAKTPADYLQVIREQRSSESNFESLYQLLGEATTWAQQDQQSALADELQEIEEKYVAPYKKAKEAGGTAWPEFEKFITQFERALTAANK